MLGRRRSTSCDGEGRPLRELGEGAVTDMPACNQLRPNARRAGRRGAARGAAGTSDRGAAERARGLRRRQGLGVDPPSVAQVLPEADGQALRLTNLTDRAAAKEKGLQVLDLQAFSDFGGGSGIRSTDLRIMIPSLKPTEKKRPTPPL